MLYLIAIVLGAALGWFRAAKRNGNRNDKLYFAFGHAMAFFVLSVFLSIVLQRVLA